MYFTYADSIEHCMDFLGGSPSGATTRDVRRSVLQAFRNLVNAHQWTYLYHRGRIKIDGPVNDGTIAYTHTGGTYEREVTLSGATWPDWAGDGYLRVGEETWKVDQRKSATVLTLDAFINPGEDVAAETTYRLFRDTYLLPTDFVAQDEALYDRWFGAMSYIHPRDWLYSQQCVESQGTPTNFTVTGDPKYPGRLVVRFAPWPDEDDVIVGYLYKRRPADPSIQEYKTGTVSMTAGNATVTGSGTAFTEAMVGTVLRISGTTLHPTSAAGDNPATFESVVISYTSATEIAVADAPSASYSAAKYTLSSPIDIEVGAMLNAYLRGIEAELAIARQLKTRSDAMNAYLFQLRLAKEADSRSFAGRYAGDAWDRGTFSKRPLWSQPDRIYSAE